MRFQENVLLSKYTTFKIGGPAKYFFVAESSEDIIKTVEAALKLNLFFFILSGGSNILISDPGFNGLVIKTQNTKYQIQNTKILSEAGVLFSKLVQASLESNLTYKDITLKTSLDPNPLQFKDITLKTSLDSLATYKDVALKT